LLKVIKTFFKGGSEKLPPFFIMNQYLIQIIEHMEQLQGEVRVVSIFLALIFGLLIWKCFWGSFR